MRVVVAMGEDDAARMFTPAVLRELHADVQILDPMPLTSFDSPEGRRAMADAEVLISGWGCPMVDDAVLDAAPSLRAIVHAGGSVKHHLAETVWQRGIVVSSATVANATPVAEYTVAMIVLANKRVFDLARRLLDTRVLERAEEVFPSIGNYGRRVGIVGASRIGRKVIELLRPYELEVVVHDPYLLAEEAALLGVAELELDELVATSDIISLHAPALPETRHLLDARLIAAMRTGATLINTARGSLVDHDALRERLRGGGIFAILDVTEPWIPPSDDVLYDLPNVLLTPHIAGSLGSELQRLASAVVQEVNRLALGEQLGHGVQAHELERIA